MDLDFGATQCAGQSIGPANQLFALLIQTIIAAKCAISPPELWPQDYAEQALANGELGVENVYLLQVFRYIHNYVA